MSYDPYIYILSRGHIFMNPNFGNVGVVAMDAEVTTCVPVAELHLYGALQLVNCRSCSAPGGSMYIVPAGISWKVEQPRDSAHNGPSLMGDRLPSAAGSHQSSCCLKVLPRLIVATQ